jgi:capsular exopolysaccharide synthesis family protein
MVLSAKADQGSTSTVTNLGITLAQAGQRVIIVDANIRTPQVHEVFGLSNEFGLTDVLQTPDAASLERALRPTMVPNLRVMTSGPGCENPWELFRSDNLTETSYRLRELADYVIYDTPSALAFTDSLNLARAVDAAYLCVRALETPSGAEQRLVELLEEANVTVLGSVLNDVPASVLDSYQNYLRYYPTRPGPEASEGAIAVAGGVRYSVEPNGTNGVNGHGDSVDRNGA